ncbi:MAG: phosphoribosyltransferase family protein [Bacteroidota bacterium]
MSEHEKVLCFSCLNALDQHLAFDEMQSLIDLFPAELKVDGVYSLFRFSQESVIQNLLHRLKYRGDEEVGKWLGIYLARKIPVSHSKTETLVIPVPMHPSKEKMRGYNQVEVIAEGLVSSFPSWKVEKNVLARSKGETSLTNLNRMERREETNRLYYLKDDSLIQGKRVLLMDDVLTTGATLIACAQLIKSANVESLFISAIAEADK